MIGLPFLYTFLLSNHGVRCYNSYIYSKELIVYIRISNINERRE